MKPLILRPAAARDVEEAYEWYESQRPGLGDEFLDEVGKVVKSIADHPELYPVIHRETRRALVRRFPYGVFYRLVANDIIVVACYHARRDPRDGSPESDV